ncbi:MAG: SDR family oxidoreductase [Myxococcales bacterium]|nr:SDR family oxidoreductase [Myxococcales bacterium]
MEIQNRIAIVTGGASGIGRAVVERFHADGARHLVVVDRDEAGAKAVADRVGGSAAALDVADEAAVRALVEAVERERGPIDVFFSNAGYATLGGLEAPVEDLQRMWEVHVVAHLYAARAVIPRMVERGEGYVLSTASAAGLLSQFGSLHYAVTKHAAVALAEWIAITHGHQGIKVSVLCPQAVATNIGRNSPDADKLRASAEDGAGVASQDGVLQPEEVAGIVCDAMREERFHILPHPEVSEYIRRKSLDVDRWIGGMQRWQGSLFPPEAHPATWLTKR